MTLPASGQISMSQVSTELGRASTYATSLGETAVRNLAGVASGEISFSNLHGKSAASVVSPMTPADGNYYSWDGGPSITLTVNNDGTVVINTYPAADATGNWASPATAGFGNNYWVKFTRVSWGQSNPWGGGATDTTGWLSLSSNRSVTVTAPGGDASTESTWATYNVQIASDASGSNIVTSRNGYYLLHEAYS